MFVGHGIRLAVAAWIVAVFPRMRTTSAPDHQAVTSRAVAYLNSRLVWGSLGSAALLLCVTFAAPALASSPRDWSGNLMLAAYGLFVAAGVLGYCCASGIRFPVLGERPSSAPEPEFPILDAPPDDDHRSELRQALDANGAVPARPVAPPADRRWIRLVIQLVGDVGWDTWQNNVYPFFDPNFPWVNAPFVQRLRRASEWILGRPWPPGHPELRAAIDAYGRVIADLLYIFDKHAEESPSRNAIATERFYRNKGNFNPRYHEDIEEYEHHVELLQDLVLEATRYANRIADLVRNEIDPDVRVEEGALLVRIVYGVFQIGLLKPEFRLEDFADGQPYKDLQAFDNIRGSRDVSMKAD